MTSLNHPNVVKMLGVCLRPPVMILEVVSGGELYDHICDPLGVTQIAEAVGGIWKRIGALALQKVVAGGGGEGEGEGEEEGEGEGEGEKGRRERLMRFDGGVVEKRVVKRFERWRGVVERAKGGGGREREREREGEGEGRWGRMVEEVGEVEEEVVGALGDFLEKQDKERHERVLDGEERMRDVGKEHGDLICL